MTNLLTDCLGFFRDLKARNSLQKNPQKTKNTTADQKMHRRYQKRNAEFKMSVVLSEFALTKRQNQNHFLIYGCQNKTNQRTKMQQQAKNIIKFQRILILL